jgi:ComF family protein
MAPPAKAPYARPMELARIVRQAGQAVLGLILPAQCLTCDATVDAPGQFCPVCFTATFFVTEPCCTTCGQAFAHAAEGGLARQCQQCRDTPPAWRLGRAALRYDDQAGRIILPFKYADRIETAAALARQMARAGASLLQDADILVPVPLHRSRLRTRRYNQSALLARAIGHLSGHPAMVDALGRTRATQSLRGQSAAARAASLQDAFAVRPHCIASIADRRVLLIDDVLTTGATANGCTLALLAAGAAQVDLLVAARVPWQAPGQARD